MAYLGHQFLRIPPDFSPDFADTYIAYEPIHFRDPRRLPLARRSQPKCAATQSEMSGDVIRVKGRPHLACPSLRGGLPHVALPHFAARRIAVRRKLVVGNVNDNRPELR